MSKSESVKVHYESIKFELTPAQLGEALSQYFHVTGQCSSVTRALTQVHERSEPSKYHVYLRRDPNSERPKYYLGLEISE